LDGVVGSHRHVEFVEDLETPLVVRRGETLEERDRRRGAAVELAGVVVD
jgi:hypothetical protein